MPDKTKILFFGDVSGSLGRQGIKEMAPIWKKKYQPDVVIANVENLAHNKGVTLKTMKEMSEAGIELFSGGNHVWKKYNIQSLSEETDYALATPANDSRTPKKYLWQEKEVNGTKLVLINLQGQTFMDDETVSNPFIKIKSLLTELPQDANIIIDLHAEATSEKRAMGFYLDGQVSAVFGTHTHVPTSDEQILPQGTAYLTDIGMVGPLDSILGIQKDIIIDKFITEDKIRHEVQTTGQIEVNAVLLEIDNNSHKTTKIEHLREIIN